MHRKKYHIDMGIDIGRDTVDGRNPASPWMVETL